MGTMDCSRLLDTVYGRQKKAVFHACPTGDRLRVDAEGNLLYNTAPHYAHQLSGGVRQRVNLARAVAS